MQAILVCLLCTDAQFSLWRMIAVDTRGGSRMRESCTYGSVRGVRGPPARATARLRVRRVRCWSTFPLVSALGSADSASRSLCLVRRLHSYLAESDFSRPCIIGYGSSPSRCGPHVAFDHEDSLRSREFIISWLTPTPYATAVYASCSASPPPHATLASRRLARPYLGRTCTGSTGFSTIPSRR
jgi:hypothetical protein